MPTTPPEIDNYGAVIRRPSADLYRVERPGPGPYFSRIPPEVDQDPAAGNRFDVAGGGVCYAATTPAGAYLETLQQFAPTTEVISQLKQIDPGCMAVGTLAAEWRDKRRLKTLALSSALPFLDVEAPETHRVLEHELAGELHSLGVQHLNTAVIRSDNRLITRLIATWAYLASPGIGWSYSGLRYDSKIDSSECWAIFDSVDLTITSEQAISLDTTFRRACEKLRINPQGPTIIV